MSDATFAFALLHARSTDAAALAALFAIDAAFGETVASTREPALGAIRLAWWREALQALDHQPPPPEPRLAAAARLLLARGIGGAELAGLEDGWRVLLDEFPWGRRAVEAVASRGRLLFGLAGRLLGAEPVTVEQAGGLWALVDAARGCSDPVSRQLLLGEAVTIRGQLRGAAVPRPARPLGMLATAAMRDAGRGEPFEQCGSRRRLAAMLVHRWSGRLPD